jgi:hypothetical protein
MPAAARNHCYGLDFRAIRVELVRWEDRIVDLLESILKQQGLEIPSSF